MPEKPHSVDVLNDLRDLWWHTDFLSLMARRWELKNVRRVLDVGCGHGHWGQLWLPLLGAGTTLTGVDSESIWIERAQARASQKGYAQVAEYKLGNAHDLPVDDNAYDWVTCQTVLMHVADPALVVREMTRATAPGGLVVAAEPNNLATTLLDITTHVEDVDDAVDLMRFQLTCRLGRIALGEGDEAIGERVPQLFADAGLVNIQVHQGDRTSFVAPPYMATEQSILENEVEMIERGAWLWDEVQAKRQYLAGGGTTESFDRFYGLFMRQAERFVAAVRAGTYRRAGGDILYLVAGRKLPLQ